MAKITEKYYSELKSDEHLSLERMVELLNEKASEPEWIEIIDNNSLPEQGGEYWVIKNGKRSMATYLKSDRWLVEGNNYPKTTEIHGITHYCKIFVPDLPNKPN